MAIIKGIAIAIIIWVMMAFVINWVGNSLLIPEQTRILVERGKPIYGKVVNKEAEDHQRIDYVYKVDGTQYSGSGEAGGGNAKFADLPVGSTVSVYYDPINPSVSFLGSPEYDLKSLRLLIRAASVAIPFWPILISFIVYFAVTRARRSAGVH